jgi:hypothetical protein
MRRVFQTFVDRLIESTDSNTLRQSMAEIVTALDLCCFAYLSVPSDSKATPLLISTDPSSCWYLARDTELKGFFVVVGKRKKTFTVQGDLRQAGKRSSSIRVAIGDASQVSTRTARATAKDYLAQISRGQHPKAEKRARESVKLQLSTLTRLRLRAESRLDKPGSGTETPT